MPSRLDKVVHWLTNFSWTLLSGVLGNTDYNQLRFQVNTEKNMYPNKWGYMFWVLITEI